MTAKATYDPQRGTITHRRRAWSNTFPVSDLAMWIAFYRAQGERFADHAAIYDGDVRALEAVAGDVRQKN
jgi:hypothetical protein